MRDINTGSELAKMVEMQRRSFGVDAMDAGQIPATTSGALFQATKMLEAHHSRFARPELSGIQGLADQLKFNSAFNLAGQSDIITNAADAMTSRWLDVQNDVKSLAAFSNIQTIGYALSNLPAFDDSTSIPLRHFLGDWRDPITWDEPELIHADYRTNLYIEHGFDPDLTDFPEDAFVEGTSIAGLRTNPPRLLNAYGLPILGDVEDEEDFARTHAAQARLFRLETNIRRFIDHLMTKAFGTDWPKHRLPNGFRDKWIEKKRKAKEAGEADFILIAYADFTDYESVINRKDNWKEVFKRHFHRSESVRETFQRLHPIRIATSHARFITSDDELFLLSESTRLMRVFETVFETE